MKAPVHPAAPRTFLDHIYRGILNEETFHACKPRRETPQVRRLIDAYREILRDYPAQSLEAEGCIPPEMLRRMAQLGLFGISIPKAYQGLGFSLWEYLRVLQEMVRFDMAVALTSVAHLSIGVKGILLFGTEAQKQKYLVPAATGEMLFSYALTEPRVGSDAQHIETRAELSHDGTHYLLNGQKTYITNANYAGGLTVFAQMDPARPGFMGAFIIETAWEGVKIGRNMPKMGLKASSTAAIQFKDVRVPVENLIGRPGDGFKIAMTVLNFGRLGLGAASVGMMDQSLEDMVKRASSRFQFGKPIKDFPLIQEKLARTRVNAFVCTALNDFVIGMLEENPLLNAAIETSHCKLFGTTRAWEATYDALQVAGGSGYLATQPYEKRMRDFRVATVFEGTTEIHSIYPALFAMRKMARENGLQAIRTPADLLTWLKELLAKAHWPLRFEHKVMAEASKFARKNAQTVKRMLLLGTLLHGKRVFDKEFFLRRVTTLSLYCFGLVAVLARMTAEGKSGGVKQSDLDLLAHFLDEAKEARRTNRWPFDSGRERLSGRIAGELFREGV